jgi:methyl-accepting chemotaxis protein
MVDAGFSRGEAMEKKRWKRKKILVDTEFQFRYLMTWILLTMSLLAGLVLVSLTVLYLLNTKQLLTYFIWVNALCAVAITGVSIYYIVLHSHRIAGPAFRLERLIREMANGRRGFRVHLRRKDYLKRVAIALNELLETLEKREARVNQLGRAVGELSHNGHDVGKVHDVAGQVSRELMELCPEITQAKGDEEE